MIRFSILIIALVFGAYAQYDAKKTIESHEKIDAISKNIGSIMAQKFSQHKQNCLHPKNCSNAMFHETKTLSRERMDSLLSKTIYAELTKN